MHQPQHHHTYELIHQLAVVMAPRDRRELERALDRAQTEACKAGDFRLMQEFSAAIDGIRAV